uniref:EF-hand domain-containing protein n=1 Tax=Leptobrachium leishanense TaxID=445787 RepID=A0A8C5QUB7_9ANUR
MEDINDNLGHIFNSASEEQMLDYAFQVCDSEGRGKVSVIQITEYLESVADPNCDGDRLQSLCTMLDPEDEGALMDLETFRTVMAKWIASCCKDGESVTAKNDKKSEETYCHLSTEKELDSDSHLEGYGGDIQNAIGENLDLERQISDLQVANKNLTEQTVKIQKSLDIADETNSQLTEEISDLKSKLKASHQAFLHAKSVRNEIEDMKTLVKTLEDKIAELSSEKKQLDKEKISLRNQLQTFQKENEILFNEKGNCETILNDLRTENSKMEHKLCEYESIISEKDDLLAQKSMQSEERQYLVDEYTIIIQELKIQKSHLQEQLLQTYEEMALSSHDPLHSLPSKNSAQSVREEIKEVEVSDQNVKSRLSSPLCGILHYSEVHTFPLSKGAELIRPRDIWFNTELLLEECNDELQQTLSGLYQLKFAWKQLSSRLNGVLKVLREQSRHVETSSASERPSRWSLVPLKKQLGSRSNDLPHTIRTTSLGNMPRLNTIQRDLLCQAWMRFRGRRSLKRLLVILVLSLVLFCPVNQRENIWTVTHGLLSPHLQLEYMQPPPI